MEKAYTVVEGLLSGVGAEEPEERGGKERLSGVSDASAQQGVSEEREGTSQEESAGEGRSAEAGDEAQRGADAPLQTPPQATAEPALARGTLGAPSGSAPQPPASGGDRLQGPLTLESIFRNAQALREDIVAQRDLAAKCISLCAIAVSCSGLYGLTMGFTTSVLQGLSAAVKVPLLFSSTLVICLPTLHFIGLLFGSRVRFMQSLTVLLWGIAIAAVLLSAFAPVSFFFLLGNSRYEFLLLMHVAIFAFCGAASLISIRKNMLYLHRVTAAPDETGKPGIFLTLWMLLYMFVGTQMAYILSPYIGKTRNFVLFHSGPGNFFSAIIEALQAFIR